MKNKLLTTSVLTAGLVSLLIYSCRKEVSEPVFGSNALRATCNYDVGLVCDNSIPHYGTQQVFDAIYLCLEAQYEQYNDNFESQYTNLSDNDFDDLADSLGFNEERTLDNWETAKGYSSLRTRLNSEEDIWIANGMDPNTDPFDHALCDIIFMTLLNVDGDMKIGSDLIHIDSEGSQIIVYGGDCDVFAQAKSDPNYTNPNLTRALWFPPDTCERHEFETGEELWTSSTDRKFKWRVDFDSYVSNSKAKTTIRNFRYKNSRWKKAKARATVEVAGQMWNNECLNQSSISFDTKTKRRRRISVRVWPFSFGKIRTSELLGYISSDGGNTIVDTAIIWP